MRVTMTTDQEELSGSERISPGETETIPESEAAGQFPVLRSFLSSLCGEGGPFAALGYKLWDATDGSTSEPAVFASRIDLLISNDRRRLDRTQYEDFASGVAKLLAREPSESLSGELQVGRARSADGSLELCLRLVLFARAAGREQARLRWSLGLARVQQALLFEARAVRQGRG